MPCNTGCPGGELCRVTHHWCPPWGGELFWATNPSRCWMMVQSCWMLVIHKHMPDLSQMITRWQLHNRLHQHSHDETILRHSSCFYFDILWTHSDVSAWSFAGSNGVSEPAKHEHFCRSANITQHVVPNTPSESVLHSSSHKNGLQTNWDGPLHKQNTNPPLPEKPFLLGVNLAPSHFHIWLYSGMVVYWLFLAQWSITSHNRR